MNISTWRSTSLNRAGVIIGGQNWHLAPHRPAEISGFSCQDDLLGTGQQNGKAHSWWVRSGSGTCICWFPWGSQEKISVQEKKMRLCWDLPAMSDVSFTDNRKDFNRYKSARLHRHGSSPHLHWWKVLPAVFQVSDSNLYLFSIPLQGKSCSLSGSLLKRALHYAFGFILKSKSKTLTWSFQIMVSKCTPKLCCENIWNAKNRLAFE